MGARRALAFVTGGFVTLLPACVLFTNFDELSEPVPPSGDGAVAMDAATSDGAVSGANETGSDVLTSGSSRYRDAVLADRPVAYWRMEVTSPGTIRDETNRGNDLVVEVGGSSAPGALAGDPSQALAFDGKTTKAHAADPRPLAFTGTAAFTIELWLKRIPFPEHAQYQQILDHAATPGGAASAVGFYLYYGRDDDRLVFLRRGAGEPTLLLAPAAAMPAHVYVHYAVTYDGATLRAVLDGTVVSSVAATDPIGERDSAFILGWNGAGGAFYPGLIDELAIYDRALTVVDLSRHRDAALGQ